MLRRLFVSILVITTGLMANSLSLSDNGDGTWSVGYESSEAIGGFQFTVDGATINSASGGDAAANGFMTSASGSTVLGFSLTGGTIPSGNGNLIDLDLAGNPSGLSSLVVSNAAGQDLGFTFDGGDPEADYIVEVGGDGNSFSPADLQIEAGETVQWVNMGGFHNVDGSTDTYPNNPDSFYSGDPSNDGWTYSFTFEIEGVYDYDCSPHASMGMVGTITVGDGGGEGVVGDEDADKLIKPRAFVVLKNGYEAGSALVEELKIFVKSKLAPFKYPRWIEFVDELPKTATGKIQRFKLRK